MIGGVTVEFSIPDCPIASATDGILTVCRRRWPEGCVLDANGDELVQFRDRDSRVAWNPPGDEFFVFKSCGVAETWDEIGPDPVKNWNEMMHFIIRTVPSANPPTTRVTVVCDEVTAPVAAFVDDLHLSLLDMPYYAEAA